LSPSSEALLISALVNNEDASLVESLAIEPDMLMGYQPEFRWILSYESVYHRAPSKEALLAKFPDFPITDHTDAAWAADEVRYNHNARMLKASIRQASALIADGDYDQAAMAIANYAPAAHRQPLLNTLADTSFLGSYGERPSSLELPWPTLQRITGGIRLGDLWYVAARTNQGKSWMLNEVMADVVLDGGRVAMFSMEMSEAQVRTRMHVVLGKRLGFAVDHRQMRDHDFPEPEYRRIVNKIRDEVPGQLIVHDSSKGRVSPATISAYAKDADLCVIDYVGLMHSPMGSRSVDDWRVLAGISNEIKEVAVHRNTRVLAAAQINREGDTPSKYPPKLKNLSGSDALGQDGDVVLTMKQYAKTAGVFSIEKNRHGEKDHLFFTRFLPNTGQFEEISRERADTLREKEMNQ
jgi:hypothetical protein